jgi:hypothetical protein
VVVQILEAVHKTLVTLLIFLLCLVALLATWIFAGRQVSLFLDRFATIETASMPIRSITYEGSGTGGILIVNDRTLSLNDADPNISLHFGSTKDKQFALASAGKVFAFGPLTSATEDNTDHLAAAPRQDDQASLVTRHSILSWPTWFDFNFITGQSPSLKRHIYYEIRWKKSSGATLQMLWRYEQAFYPRPGRGWKNGFATGEDSTGLVRIEIKK